MIHAPSSSQAAVEGVIRWNGGGPRGANASWSAWRFAADPAGSPGRRGARAGLIVGLASHPLCWPLFGAKGLAGGQFQIASPAQAAKFFLLLLWTTVTTLGVLGWISAPLGAMIEYLAGVISSTRGPAENSPFRRKAVDDPCNA